MLNVAEVCPAAMVTVLGTVASVVSLELRVTTKSLSVLVLRVIVAVAVPVSEMMPRSMVNCKLGLSLSMMFKLAVAFPVGRATFELV